MCPGQEAGGHSGTSLDMTEVSPQTHGRMGKVGGWQHQACSRALEAGLEVKTMLQLRGPFSGEHTGQTSEGQRD